MGARFNSAFRSLGNRTGWNCGGSIAHQDGCPMRVRPSNLSWRITVT